MELPLVRLDELAPHERALAEAWNCPPTFDGGPVDPQPPTRVVERRAVEAIELLLPPRARPRGRDRIPVWILADPADAEGRFPSPPIRARQGDVVHALVTATAGAHGIHWHGLEPTPCNDGVGQTSFVLTRSFVYQLATRRSGTFLYREAAPLLFELGLYGLLVVDPPEGEGFVAAHLPDHPGFDPAGGTVPWSAEALWVPDEFDSRWQDLGLEAFDRDCADPLVPPDPFRPDVFVVSGVPSDGKAIEDPRVALEVARGETILVRLVHAGATLQEYTLALDATVIAIDGHALGAPPFGAYGAPFVIPGGTPFRLTSGRRFDLLLRPAEPGAYPCRFRFLDPITGALLHNAATYVTVR